MSEAILPSSPAALRNRAPIGDILAEELPARGRVLEIASGGGEHVRYFAERFPQLEWQPSDPDGQTRVVMQARFAEAPLANLRQPIGLDAGLEQWPIDAADAVLCINMIHISDWASTIGLVGGAARLLASGAALIVYGPFIESGVDPAPSNLDFDRSLRARDPRWGLRRREDLDGLAVAAGFDLAQRVAMPANNLLLVYRKRA